MNLSNIRNFVLEKVRGVAPVGAFTFVAGDVIKPDLLDVRARVKILPAQTSKIGLGLTGYKQGEGLVVIDLYGAIASGYEQLEEFGERIVESMPLTTHALTDGETVHIWSVWVEQTYEETPYFHIPVFIRWTSIHN